MRCALYARYSHDRQNDRSIEDQFEIGRRTAGARGWRVVAEYSDAAISGAAMANRPGLNALLVAADARQFDVVLVEDTDRLARNREHDAHVWNRLSYAQVTLATFASPRVDVIESTFKGLMNELYLVQLGEKTKRGVRSNAEKGLATGAKLFGYNTQPGGAISIDEEQAEVVRRIHTLFADYRLSGREIADALNRDRVAGPRGGYWNASTIVGERKRGNGILRSEIYAGIKVWGRDEVRKDPRTGQRVHHYKPPEEWNRTPVEQLRIVPQELWDRTQARLAETAHMTLSARGNQRKPGLFSGLLKCGQCGASYTSYRRGEILCAGHRERGPSVCSNSKILQRAPVEQRILEGLRTRMLSPQAVEIYVRKYQAVWTEAERERLSRRRPLEKRLAELTRQVERLVDAICDGTATAAMKERLVAYEAEKAEIEADLATAAQDAPPALPLPGTAKAYAGIVDRLLQTLDEFNADVTADGANRKLIDAVRGLVTKIEIIPNPRGRGGVDLRMHGELTRLMQPLEGEQMPPLVGGRTVAGGKIGPAPSTVPAVFSVPFIAEAA